MMHFHFLCRHLEILPNSVYGQITAEVLSLIVLVWFLVWGGVVLFCFLNLIFLLSNVKFSLLQNPLGCCLLQRNEWKNKLTQCQILVFKQITANVQCYTWYETRIENFFKHTGYCISIYIPQLSMRELNMFFSYCCFDAFLENMSKNQNTLVLLKTVSSTSAV